MAWMTLSTFIAVELLTATICCIAGFMAASIIKSYPSTMCDEEANPENTSDQAVKLESLMVSLKAMTSEVGAQVGEHNERIVEITQTLESGGSSPDRVLAAGGLLISANRQLQAQLTEARAEIDRQRDELGRSMRDSLTDPLTGIANRRAFDHELAQAIATAQRRSKGLALIMIDIDHFKRVNDTNGHMVGDQLLKAFARKLSQSFRDNDLVSRFGGEEFAVILPLTNLRQGGEAAERVRSMIEDCDCVGREVSLRITASMGVAELLPEERDVALIKRADAALYGAKKAGRNRVYVHDGQRMSQVIIEIARAPLADQSSVSVPERELC